MNPRHIRLFIYSNMRKGRAYHDAFIAKGASHIATGEVYGFRLYQVWAGCPSAVAHEGPEGIVLGDLFDCTPEALLYADNLLHCDNELRKYVVCYFKVGESVRTATAWMHYREKTLPTTATPIKDVFECKDQFNYCMGAPV